jgi:hypothetical protein
MRAKQLEREPVINSSSEDVSIGTEMQMGITNLPEKSEELPITESSRMSYEESIQSPKAAQEDSEQVIWFIEIIVLI